MIIALFLLAVVSLGYIDLTPDDWLHRGVFLGNFEELFYAVHIAVIGDGKRRHAKFFCPLKQIIYGRKPVQNGVLGVDVKVHKTHVTKIIKKRRPENRTA